MVKYLDEKSILRSHCANKKVLKMVSRYVSAQIFKDGDRVFYFVKKVEAEEAPARSDAFWQMAVRHCEPPAQLIGDTWPYVVFEIVGLIFC